MNIVFGVVGEIASGKSALVNYLTKYFNFVSFSLSSIVHDELKKKGTKNFTRETLQDIGDDLRIKEGNDVLARKVLNQLNRLKSVESEKIIIDGIRNPGEIELFKKNTNFILIGVKAKRSLRFQRLLSRNKDWDPKNWADFLAIDKRDLGLKENKNGQQVGKCLTYCNYILTNNQGIEDFQRKVNKLTAKFFLKSAILK